MTRAELIEKIAEVLQEANRPLTKAAIEDVLNALGDVGAAELLGGGEIPLRGLGRLKVQNTAARQGHNPRTGEEITIPAGRKIVFSTFSALKDALKG